MTLTFHAPHRYRLDGQWVPSVTGIRNAGGGCEGLVKWAAEGAAAYAFDRADVLAGMDRAEFVDLVAGAARRQRDAAAQAGVDVHRHAQHLIAGEEVHVADALVPYVRQARSLIERHDMMALLTETLVGSRTHLYAGRLDLVARLVTVERGEHRALVDWKTGKSVWSDVALQLAGYAFAEFAVVDRAEIPVPEVDAYYVAHIGPGSAELIPVKVDSQTFDAFLASRRRYEFDHIKVDEILGPPVEHPPAYIDAPDTGPGAW